MPDVQVDYRADAEAMVTFRFADGTKEARILPGTRGARKTATISLDDIPVSTEIASNEDVKLYVSRQGVGYYVPPPMQQQRRDLYAAYAAGDPLGKLLADTGADGSKAEMREFFGSKPAAMGFLGDMTSGKVNTVSGGKKIRNPIANAPVEQRLGSGRGLENMPERMSIPPGATGVIKWEDLATGEDRFKWDWRGPGFGAEPAGMPAGPAVPAPEKEYRRKFSPGENV